MKIIGLQKLPKCGGDIGVFIGSFDPIHRGHQELAIKSLKYLEQVWFYPVGNHIKKSLTPVETRIKALEKIDNNSFAVLKVWANGIINPGPGWDDVFGTLVKTMSKNKFWLIRGVDKLESNSYVDSSSPRFGIPHILGVDTCIKTGLDKTCLIQKLGWFDEVKLIGLQKYGYLSSSEIKQKYETL